VDRSIASGSLLLGVVIGFVMGAAYARFRRAWVDVGKSKTQLAGLRKVAWAMTRAATTKVGLVGILVIAAVAYAAFGPR
jgi:hypothetical protein